MAASLDLVFQQHCSIIQGYLETTKKSVEAKAIQNELMLKEISMHQKERKTLEADIEKLKRSITHIKSSLKRRVFTK